MRTIFLSLFILTQVFFLFSSASALSSNMDEVFRFRWAFIHNKPDNGQAKVVDPDQMPVLTQNDQLRIYLQPQDNVYIYLYLLDSQKNLNLLFPPAPLFYDDLSPEKKEYYLPGQHEWFSLDNKPGIEKFYIIGSSRRLDNLEKLTKKYIEDKDDFDLRASIIQELKILQKKHSKISSQTEKAVSIVGTIKRGVPKADLEKQAIQVEATVFYSRILRFQHE